MNTSDAAESAAPIETEVLALEALDVAERRLGRKVKRFAAMAGALAPIVSNMSETFAAREDAERITDVLAWLARDYRREEKRLAQTRRKADG
jgi:hypothetical protein